MSFASKMIKNSLSNSAAFAVEAIVAFVMMPFVVFHLGDSAYGIWVLINALTGYLGLFKMGFRPSINKHVAQYKALDDSQSLRQFVGASLHIYIWVSVAIMLAAVFVSWFLPQWFQGADDYLTIFRVLVLFAGVQSAASLIGTAYGGVISGYQRYEINAGIEIAVILSRAATIYLLLPTFNSLYTVAIAHFSLTILGYLVTMISAKKIAPLKQLSILKKPSPEILKVIIKYNSVSFAIAAFAIVINYVDSIVVGLILPVSVITHYVVGDRLVKYCLTFLNVSTKVIAPAISELDAKKDKQKVNLVLKSTHRISCILVYPVLIALLLVGGEFISLWMGDGFDDSYQVMQILALATLFIAPSQAINSYLYGLGQHKYLLYILAAELFSSVPLAFYLGLEYGISGVAIGISVPRAIMRSIVLPLVLQGISSENIFGDFTLSKIRVLLASIPFAGCLFWLNDWQSINSWWLFVVEICISLLVYAIFAYMIGLNRDERNKIKHLLIKNAKNTGSL